MAEFKEILGERFHIVEKGLDPNEITDYLIRNAGSSDTIFRQLEQFSAFQAATKTIDDAIKQARDLSEQAKVKATEEAERMKMQAIEDLKKIAVEVIKEAEANVISYADKSSSIWMEAIEETSKKTKEQIAGARTEMCEKIDKVVEAKVGKMTMGINHTTQEPPESMPMQNKTTSTAKDAGEASSDWSDPWKDARG
jgi:hypothetical protein